MIFYEIVFVESGSCLWIRNALDFFFNLELSLSVLCLLIFSVEELLGYSARELLGKSAYHLVHPDDVLRIMSFHQKCKPRK